jgi:hypothetical protein
VVDALDECPENDPRREGNYNPRSLLLSSIQRLLRSRRINVMVIITSRPLPAITAQLKWPEIPIKAQTDDIKMYLKAQIESNPRIRDYKQSDMIKDKIIANSQGRYVI